MGRPKDLYNTDLENIRIGITPGSHVIHMIGEKGKGNEGVEIKALEGNDQPSNYSSDEMTSGYGQVSKTEVFTNDADLKTKDFFIDLIKKSSEDYKKNFGPYDKEVKTFLDTVRDYVTANSRSGQQDALKNMKLKMGKLSSRAVTDARKLKEGKFSLKDSKSVTKEEMDKFNGLSQLIPLLEDYKKVTDLSKGDLKIDPETEKTLKTAEEPEITFFGRTVKGYAPGSWTPTNDALFPHEPSPNDVKQGVGLRSCYMLSSLTALAAKHPEKIKEAMKDNGDGTVTVRFFDKSKDKEEEYTPVFVKVNKTVNKTPFNSNVYASSSPWVQMMEKAYAEFLTMKERERENDPNIKTSMSIADTNSPTAFIEAFEGRNASTVNFGFGKGFDMFKQDENHKYISHPPYYVPEEKAIFKVLENAVNNRKETATVGVAGRNEEKYLNSVGIRVQHAYTLNKVFSKEINGKTQYFVQLRDPYATFEAGYDQDGKLVDKSEKFNATKNAGMENMGTFNLELKDFLNTFTDVTGVSEQTWEEMKAAKADFRTYSKPNSTYKETYPLTEEEMKGEEFYDHSHKGSALREQQFWENYLKTDKESEVEFGFYVNSQEPENDFELPSEENTEVKNDEKQPDSFDDFEIMANPKEAEKLESIADVKKEEPRQEVNHDYDGMELDDFELPPQVDADQILADSLDDEKIYQISRNLSRSAAELAATDNFYVLTNTKPFTDMKKSLNSFVKELNGTIKQKGISKDNFIGKLGEEEDYKKDVIFTKEEKLAIAKKLNALQQLAGSYAEKKYNALTGPNVKSSDYSERAMSRFAIAADIKNVCSLDYPQTNSPRRTAQLIAVSYADMMRNLAAYNKNVNRSGLSESFDFGEDKSINGDNQDFLSEGEKSYKLETALQKREAALKDVKAMAEFLGKNPKLNKEVESIIESSPKLRDAFVDGKALVGGAELKVKENKEKEQDLSMSSMI